LCPRKIDILSLLPVKLVPKVFTEDGCFLIKNKFFFSFKKVTDDLISLLDADDMNIKQRQVSAVKILLTRL